MVINRIMCISKTLIDLRFTKQRIKAKSIFAKVVYGVLVLKILLTKHIELCLSINGAQSVRLEKGTIEFKNYFKQIPVSFKIYADFEYNLKSVETYDGFYSKNTNIAFLVVLLTQLFVLMINLLSQ